MSKSKHAQSTYKLAEMPKCIKCKGELVLTIGKYDGIKEFIEEWECSKCGRIFSKSQVKEPKFSNEDRWLNEWVKKNNKM